MVGQSHISIQFKPEEDQNKQTLFQVQGSTGLTKNLRIEPVKISMPVLAFNDALNALTWKNVKNADYYCLYEAGSPDPLTDNNGEVIYIQTGEVSVGGDMFYKISDILQGVHMLQVRAFSNNPNIQASDFSDMLQVTIW